MTEGGGKSINVPVIGPTKSVYVYGGLAVVAVVVGYAYWKRSAGGAEDPSYYADLRTGSSTGSDAYEGANDSISGTSGSAAYDAVPKVPTTDQEWTAAVVATLTHYEPEYLYAVLGKYLARQPISAEEAVAVRAAWAAVGRPPGNQQILTAADTSTPGTSKAPGAPTGLKQKSVTSTSVTFTWTAVAGATSYRVYRSDGAVATVGTPAFTTSTLKAATSYSFAVAAVNTYGESPKSAALAVTTPAAPKGTKPTTPAVAYHTVRVDTSRPGFDTLLHIAAAHKVTTSSIMADPKNAHLRGKKAVKTGDIVYIPVKK